MVVTIRARRVPGSFRLGSHADTPKPLRRFHAPSQRENPGQVRVFELENLSLSRVSVSPGFGF